MRCRYHADPVLAGLIAFDDGDIRITDFVFNVLLKLRAAAIGLQGIKDRDSADARRGPQKDFRRSMLTQNLGFH